MNNNENNNKELSKEEKRKETIYKVLKFIIITAIIIFVGFALLFGSCLVILFKDIRFH